MPAPNTVTPSRVVSLRQRILTTVFVAAVPLALYSAIVLFLFWQYQHEQLQRSHRDTTAVLAAAVRAEIDSTLAHLKSLSNSGALQSTDTDAFRVICADVVRSRGDWRNVILADAEGNQVFDTLHPDGPRSVDRAMRSHIDRVFADGHWTVSDLLSSGDEQQFVAVSVPVIRDGRVIYALVASIRFDWFDALLRTHDRGGAISLVDSQVRIISRSLDATKWRGLQPVQELVRAMQQEHEGQGEMRTMEGVKVQASWSVVRGTPWRIVTGFPDTLFGTTFSWTLIALALGGGLIFSVAMTFAVRTSRQLRAGIEIAAQRAPDVTEGKPVVLPPTGTREVDQLGDALSRAALAIAEARAQRDLLMEQEQAAREKAEQMNRAKDEFLAMLGHEIRNPMAAIANAAHLLGRPGMDNARLEFAADIISRQTKQLTRIVDDLLDVGRVVSGKVNLKMGVIDLCECTKAAIESLELSGRARLHGIDLSGCETTHVEADPTRMEQVVLNLLGNAVAYSPANARIEVAIRTEADSAVLTVKDHGIGLTADQQYHIFDLFYQVNSGLQHRDGLGVGLTLVRTLVELHHGTVSVYSEGAGKGSTFTVRLPLSSAPVTAHPGVSVRLADAPA